MKTLLTVVAAVMLSVSATVSACEFSGGGVGGCDAPVSVHNPNAPLPDGVQVLVDMLSGRVNHSEEEMDAMRSGLMDIINGMAGGGGYQPQPNQDEILGRAALRGECDIPTFDTDSGVLKLCKGVIFEGDGTTVWEGELNLYWDGNVLVPAE